MLRYNFSRIFKIKGIERPYSFLINHGFSDRLASRLHRNEIRRIDLNTVERLCLLFQCTPDDLMEWVPDQPVKENADHPLHKLKRIDPVVDIVKTLNKVPVEKLDEIQKLIHDTIGDQ